MFCLDDTVALGKLSLFLYFLLYIYIYILKIQKVSRD